MLTTPEEFAKSHFCVCRKFCNRCRNDRTIRIAILSNHAIGHNGSGCPLNLPWDTEPKDLPTEARWECPGEPEHEHWLLNVKPSMDLLTADLEFERKHGRAALLDMKVREHRAQQFEIEEAAELNGVKPNKCPLKEQTTCGCTGGGWIVCHYPDFLASGLSDENEYTPKWVNLPTSAREAIPEAMMKMLGPDPAAIARAEFRAALETACRKVGGCIPEHREDCDKCWKRKSSATVQEYKKKEK